MLLKDKVCIVAGVGADRSIGFAAARLFAQHGAKLVISNITLPSDLDEFTAKLTEGLSGAPTEIAYVECDVTSPASCKALAAAALERFGRIDSLVNCVGIVGSQKLLEITENDLEQMLAVNLKGAFYLCQSVLPAMSAQGAGSIVNIASLAAQRGGGLVGSSHYAASKAGLISLSHSIAREFGPLGIRANSVCPSATETPMLDGRLDDEQIAAIASAIPLRRPAKPSDIAGVCLFLASELSAYVTGATMDVNGGSHIR